jgi:hypothetical protein
MLREGFSEWAIHEYASACMIWGRALSAGTPAARALHTAGLLANIQQAHSETRQLVEESLALLSSLNDELGESWARLTLGLIEFMAENADEATRHLERSLAMHEALGHRLGVSRSLTFLGATMTLIPSSAVHAREDLKRALQTAHALTDSWAEGSVLPWTRRPRRRRTQARRHRPLRRTPDRSARADPSRRTRRSSPTNRTQGERCGSSTPATACANDTPAGHLHSSGAEQQRSAHTPNSESTQPPPSKHGTTGAR